MKQKELAESIGISAAYLSTVETNQKPLTDDLIRRIEAVLGELPDTLESDTGLHTAKKPSSRGEGLRAINSIGNAVVPFYRTVVRGGRGGVAYDEETEDFDIAEHYAGTAVYEVSGESMILAGIEEGDRLIVKLGYRFRNRSIILCRFNGELMVKGAAVINGVIWCFPANEHHHEWSCGEGDQFECLGVVKEIIKLPHTEWWSRWNFNKLGKPTADV